MFDNPGIRLAVGGISGHVIPFWASLPCPVHSIRTRAVACTKVPNSLPAALQSPMVGPYLLSYYPCTTYG